MWRLYLKVSTKDRNENDTCSKIRQNEKIIYTAIRFIYLLLSCLIASSGLRNYFNVH